MRLYRHAYRIRWKETITASAILFITLLCLPDLCAADQGVDLTVGALIEMAAAVMPLIYIMAALCAALFVGNVVSLISVWQVIPDALRRRIGGWLDAKDYEAIQAFVSTEPKCIVGRSVCAGLKTDPGGQRHLDQAAVLSSFQALVNKFYLSPRALKAFGLIVLLVCLWALGAELVRFYTVLYERMAVVVGNYPFRKLFQEGAARLMVLAMGGFSVSVVALISGFLFSGIVRAILTQRASVLVQMLSEENR